MGLLQINSRNIATTYWIIHDDNWIFIISFGSLGKSLDTNTSHDHGKKNDCRLYSTARGWERRNRTHRRPFRHWTKRTNGKSKQSFSSGSTPCYSQLRTFTSLCYSPPLCTVVDFRSKWKVGGGKARERLPMVVFLPFPYRTAAGCW